MMLDEQTDEQLDNIYRQKYLDELASVKTPGTVDTCSKEEFEWRIKEIAKCKRSINYFVEHWYKIVNLDQGLMTINLYSKQRELLDFLVNEKRSIVLAARQSGKTTIYVAYLLWLTQFFPEKKVMILANKADTALEILSRLRLAWEYLPSFLKNAAVIFNKGELLFSNLSGVKGFATSSDAARGYSCNCVHGNTYVKIRLFKSNKFIFKIQIKFLHFLTKRLNFLTKSLNFLMFWK